MLKMSGSSLNVSAGGGVADSCGVALVVCLFLLPAGEDDGDDHDVDEDDKKDETH